ncbi:MAG TPA: O-antigen ligase family protein [Pyrinomonadaceae bacterium]
MRTPSPSSIVSRLKRLAAGEPLRVAAALWPLVLLTPYFPWLPRPVNGGLTWRQEGALAALLCLAFGLLLRRRAAERGAHAPAGPDRLNGLLTASLAAYVLWSAASATRAPAAFAAWHYALSWLSYLLFFLLLRRGAASPRLLLYSHTALAVVVFVISLSCVIGHYGSADSLIRRNGLGEPMAVAVPLFAALAMRLRSRRAAALCGVTAVTAWLSTLQVAERSPFLGALVGLALLGAAMTFFAHHRPRSLRRVLLVCGALCACVVVQAVPSPFAQSAHRPIHTRLKETSASELNTRSRMLYWGAALEMWRARPLDGVGAGNYDASFPRARASFTTRHPDSPLAEVNEQFLTTGAHNEYLQILAELGAVGLALFVTFAGGLLLAAWRALRGSRSPLAPGAVASLAVFAISSGASSISFRWMGSGLLFFCAAALVSRLALAASRPEVARLPSAARPPRLPAAHGRAARACGLALAAVVLGVMCVQAVSVLQLARAQAAPDPARAEGLYRAALAWNPLDPATHYNYGIWLYFRKREGEAVPHLRFAAEHGFNASPCYAYLAGAEANSGDLAASERTLARAVAVYPRSVFMRVRHAAALGRLGRAAEAELEMSAALLIDSRAARGWQQLIERDIDPAVEAARLDAAAIAMPGQLIPQEGVFAVLEENEKRFPAAVTSGWRARAFKLR